MLAAGHPAASSTVYIVTGATRGIGFGLVSALAARPNSLVYASARDASKAEQLHQLAKQHSNLHVLQLDVRSDEEHTATVRLVEAEAGRVDVVVANAGVSLGDAFAPIDKAPIALMQLHYEVNTIAPLRLFQHFLPLLTRSSNPKFVVITSAVSSISAQQSPTIASMLLSVYGSSKAAVNFLTMRMHVEHANITAFPCAPGTATRTQLQLYSHSGVMQRSNRSLLACFVLLLLLCQAGW